MAIVSASALYTPLGNDAIVTVGRHLFRYKQFLVDLAGWTVAGSSTGAAGTMDGVDRWAASTDIGANAWTVLQSPHAAPADRVQVMLYRTAGATTSFYAYCPHADYTGGAGATRPTSTSATSYDFTGTHPTPSSGTGGIVNMTADNAPPYGFLLSHHEAGLFTGTRGLHALFPLTKTPPGAGKPYVAWNGTLGTAALTASSSTVHGVAEPGNPPQVPLRAQGANIHINTGNQMMTPYSSPVLPGGYIGLNMPWILDGTCIYGVSPFIKYAPMNTAGGGVLGARLNNNTWIALDDVIVRWSPSVNFIV